VFLAIQSDLEVRSGLIRNRVRWLVVDLATAVVGATAMMLLIVVWPLSAVPLALADACIGFALHASREAGRPYWGRIVDVLVTAAIVAVALVLAGGFLLPTIDFFGAAVPV